MANVDITVQHAEGDSDYIRLYKICTVACRSAQAAVIADYTDIFLFKFGYHAQGRVKHCLSLVEAEPAICI